MEDSHASAIRQTRAIPQDATPIGPRVIETIADQIVGFIAWLLLSVTINARVAITCDPWFVAGVTPKGNITCMEPFPKGVCCGAVKGPCEKECPFSSKTEIRKIYCTGGSVPVIRDHRTVGCTR